MFSIRVFFSLLLLALVTPIADATGSDVNDAPVATGTPASGNTVFNGVEVPPMRELVGEQLDGDISKGYW